MPYLRFDAAIDCREVLEERTEQRESVRQVLHPHRLAYGMHRQLRTSDVYRPYACIRAQYRPDGAAAAAVVPDHELLHRGQLRPARQLPHDQARHRARRVTLVGIALYHHPPVHFGPVTFLVLGRVVGMDGVGHVDAEEEAPSYCAIVEGRLARSAAAARQERVADAPDRLADDRTPGPRRRLAPDCAASRWVRSPSRWVR